jgi:hypothetical protein
MMVRLGVVVVLAALASACGGGGQQPKPTSEPTTDPDDQAAIEAVVDWRKGGDLTYPVAGEEFDCALQAGGPPPGFSVEGRCVWEATPSSDGRRVTYTEEWRCADFSGIGSGYEDCTGEYGRYVVEYVIRHGDEVEGISSSGQLPPGAVE